MTPLGFVPDDGYTESGWINEVPHLHPRVSLTWRPMTTTEVAAYAERAAPLDGPKTRKLAAATMAGKIKAWDLKGADEKVQPVTPAVLLSLKEKLFQKLFAVVSGHQPPDGSTGKLAAEEEAEFEDLLRAAEEGRSLVEVREEREVKNS